jgi:hypothetical protein
MTPIFSMARIVFLLFDSNAVFCELPNFGLNHILSLFECTSFWTGLTEF